MIYASSMLFYKINKQELKEVLNKLKVSCSNNIDFSLRLFFFTFQIQFKIFMYINTLDRSLFLQKGLLISLNFKKLYFINLPSVEMSIKMEKSQLTWKG